MIRDNGPGILFLPVKMMKDAKSTLALGECCPNPNPNPNLILTPNPNSNTQP